MRARYGDSIVQGARPVIWWINPFVQAKKFDPDGAYVRRWIPELRRVRGAAVHQPWTLSPIEQRAAGCVIGRDYPAPLVEHHMAREHALAAYRQTRMEAT
jgi:deoxyribodipyrimidine photo-lyase